MSAQASTGHRAKSMGLTNRGGGSRRLCGGLEGSTHFMSAPKTRSFSTGVFVLILETTAALCLRHTVGRATSSLAPSPRNEARARRCPAERGWTPMGAARVCIVGVGGVGQAGGRLLNHFASFVPFCRGRQFNIPNRNMVFTWVSPRIRGRCWSFDIKQFSSNYFNDYSWFFVRRNRF